jgi:PKD repeat protein
VYVGQNVGDCYNYFTYQAAGNTLLFSGFHSTNLPAMFEWSFGDGTSGTGQQISHTYASEGTYYVTLLSSDANNCTAVSAQIVVVGDSIIFNQVYGQVFEGNFPLASGLVMIFGINSEPGFTPFNDFVLLDSSGVFLFPYVPNGAYVLYAIPLNYSGYLPTYYGDVIVWDDAAIIELGEANNPYNINLVPIDMSQNQGNGTISGLITVSAERSGMVDKVKVLLFNQNYQAMGFTNVHADGTFSFDNLADGTYYIYPELPGMKSGYIRVDLTESHNHADVFLNMTEDSILGASEIPSVSVSAVMYPNPAVHQTTLAVNSDRSTNVSVTVYDISGRAVQSMQAILNPGNNNIVIPVSQLQQGIYFIRLITGEGEQLNQRLIKN